MLITHAIHGLGWIVLVVVCGVFFMIEGRWLGLFVVVWVVVVQIFEI